MLDYTSIWVAQFPIATYNRRVSLSQSKHRRAVPVTARQPDALLFLFFFLYFNDLSSFVKTAIRADDVWQDHGTTISASHQVGGFQCIMSTTAVSAALREFTLWLWRHFLLLLKYSSELDRHCNKF